MKNRHRFLFGAALLMLSPISRAEESQEIIFDEAMAAEFEEQAEILLDEIGAVEQDSSKVVYVPMPVPAEPQKYFLTCESAQDLQKSMRTVCATMKEFIERMSRNKIEVTTRVGIDQIALPKGYAKKVRLVLIPGAHSHVPIIGNTVTARHELLHQFNGLGHANTRIWKTQTVTESFSSSRDPFDPLTLTPGTDAMNAPHLHFMKWFSPTEEAFAQPGGEYVLSLINKSGRDFKSLKALYYEVPGSATGRKVWFSYVKVVGKGWNVPEGMPGTAIAIHEAAGSSTFLEGLLGSTPKTNIRSGLILELSEITAQTVKVKVSLDPDWVLEE